jgi:hypothetical protein
MLVSFTFVKKCAMVYMATLIRTWTCEHIYKVVWLVNWVEAFIIEFPWLLPHSFTTFIKKTILKRNICFWISGFFVFDTIMFNWIYKSGFSFSLILFLSFSFFRCVFCCYNQQYYLQYEVVIVVSFEIFSIVLLYISLLLFIINEQCTQFFHYMLM